MFSHLATRTFSTPVSHFDVEYAAQRKAEKQGAPDPDQSPSHCLGLDLGQEGDPSALCVLEYLHHALPFTGPAPWGKSPKWGYKCKHLHRWHLQTSYVDIAEQVAGLLDTPALEGSFLIVDATGNRPFVDILRRLMATKRCRFRLIPMQISYGGAVVQNEKSRYWNVGKFLLVNTMVILLQQGKLILPPQLHDLKYFMKELRDFRVKMKKQTEKEQYEARDREHDDLVMAVSYACWWAEKGQAQLKVW